MFKKNMTVAELEKLEAEDKARLETIRVTIEAEHVRQLEIKNVLAEEYKATSPELEQSKATISSLEDEADIVQIRLNSFAKKKDFARGVEIEKVEIPKLKMLSANLGDLVAEVKTTAAPMIAASNKLFDHLEGFENQDATKSLRLQSEFLDIGVSRLRVLAPSNDRVYRDPQRIDLDIVLLAMTYDGEKLEAWLKQAQTSLEKRVEKMRYHAKRLKGEDVPAPKWEYCPHCYEYIDRLEPKGKNRCTKCRKTF
ncbi:MAG: hypothetical protein C4583_09195 [Anaerolineaceae bacterium]|nr:MAG: hypothetical protein C4583_09195 [Anaerolineaceae bacterium]